MATQVFINLPVKDLKKSMTYYEGIGFANNPKFTDHTAACMVMNNSVFVMLLTYDKFKQFTTKAIIDATKTAGVINAISLESFEEVDAFVERAKKVGGREYAEAKDYGFMRQRSIEDPDGHNWEVFYMDESKFPG